MSTTGKRGRPRKDTVGKPQARKRAAPRTRASSHAENDEYEPDGEIDDTLQYVDEELQPGYAYIGKKSVPLRSVSLTNPLPKAPEDRLQALDLPDPVFLWQWTNYFNTILVGSPNDYSLHMNSFRQQLVETYSYSNQQEYAVKNLAHLDKMIGQIFGVGRRFGLLGDSMKDITMEPVHVELNQDGTPVWQPEIPDHQMLADLIYAMADGSGIVDMDSTKPWKHWQKMRLIDFATVAERVMHSLKRQYAGYPPGHKVNNFTFTERYNNILDLLKTCKGSVVRMHRPSTLEELLLNPKKMKQRFLDNQVNNLKKKMDANDLRILRAKEKVVEWDKERNAALEAGEPEPVIPDSPIFRAAYADYLIERNKIAAGVHSDDVEAGLLNLGNEEFTLDDDEDSDNPFSDSDDEGNGRRKRRKKSAKQMTQAQRVQRSRLAEARRRNVPLRHIPKEKAPMQKAPFSLKDLKAMGWDKNPEIVNALHHKESELNRRWDEARHQELNQPQAPIVRELNDGRLVGEMQFVPPQQDHVQEYQQDYSQLQQLHMQMQHDQQQQQQHIGFEHWSQHVGQQPLQHHDGDFYDANQQQLHHQMFQDPRSPSVPPSPMSPPIYNKPFASRQGHHYQRPNHPQLQYQQAYPPSSQALLVDVDVANGLKLNSPFVDSGVQMGFEQTNFGTAYEEIGHARAAAASALAEANEGDDHEEAQVDSGSV